jgi:hypothetical protein
MCTLCDSTNINTIMEFVPNSLYHVSDDGFNGGSDSYLQFRNICGKWRNVNLILDVTPKADSHIAYRAHAVSLPCRAAKGVECAFPFDSHSAAVSDSHFIFL